MAGACVQVAPTGTGGFAGVLVDASMPLPIGSGGNSGSKGSGGHQGGNVDAAFDQGNGTGANGANAAKISACACDSAGPGSGAAWLATALLAAMAMVLRRRRQ